MISTMPFPYVRIIEVKTKVEDVWNAFQQLLWFKERGLANFYFIALPKDECNKISLGFRQNFCKDNIGLVAIDLAPTYKELEANVSIWEKPKFEIRKRDWEGLYMELEKQGNHKLVEKLRETAGKTHKTHMG